MSVSVVIVEKGVAEVYIDHPPVNAPDSTGWNKIAETITVSRQQRRRPVHHPGRQGQGLLCRRRHQGAGGRRLA